MYIFLFFCIFPTIADASRAPRPALQGIQESTDTRNSRSAVNTMQTESMRVEPVREGAAEIEPPARTQHKPASYFHHPSKRTGKK